MEEYSFLAGGYARPNVYSLVKVNLYAQPKRLQVENVTDQLQNPSWLQLHPNGRILYAVEERVPDGGIAVLEKDDKGWSAIKRLPAGSAPCHLSLDDQAHFLFVSNYMDGSLDVWRLDPAGIPLEKTDTVHHQGHGPNPFRQEGPHIHSSLFVDGLVYTADLGMDQVIVYRLDSLGGKLTECQRIPFPAGSGPRHMAIHPLYPDLLYVNSEMGGDVFVLSRKTGTLVQSLKVVPNDFQEAFRASAIHFSGNTLYASCRECNVITLFDLQQDGTLGHRRIYRHRQQTPRDVWMDKRWCITADEGSEGLTLLKRTGETLEQVAFVHTPHLKPTCIFPLPG